MPIPESLLIVGASVRAAAESAARAGLRVHGIDLFADEDTRDCCGMAVQVGRLDDAINHADQIQANAFIYTGCVENRPDLITQLSANFQLFGNDIDTLTKVRDPFWLQQVATKNDFNFPATVHSPTEISESNEWLRKPFASGGGANIQQYFANRKSFDSSQYYLQQKMNGVSYSAVFVRDSRETFLIGVSQQVLSDERANPDTFHFRGNIGPVQLSPVVLHGLNRIGSLVAEVASMRGLFGIDFMLKNDDVFVIEINPRYTASMELFEQQCANSLIDAHVQACDGQPVNGLFDTDANDSPDANDGNVRCKLIQFSQQKQPFDVSAEFNTWRLNLTSSRGSIHDIPSDGTRIFPGEPIFTAIASGTSTMDARRNCEDLIAEATQIVIGKQSSAN